MPALSGPLFRSRSDLLDDAAEVLGERLLQRLRARGVRGDLAEVDPGGAQGVDEGGRLLVQLGEEGLALVDKVKG